MHRIAEKDWKRLRAMQEEKLDQVCAGIIQDIASAIRAHDQEHGHHKTYLELWDIIHAGDARIAEMFDDLRRSNAVLKLAAWQRNGLLNKSELKEFSEETRALIIAIKS